MAYSTAPQIYPKLIIIIALLAVNSNKVRGGECGCSIDIHGPFFGSKFVIVCHDHSYSFEDSRQLKYSWLFSNASFDTPTPISSLDNLYLKVFRNSMKFELEFKIEDTYTCVVHGPGRYSPESCSITLSATPGETKKKKTVAHWTHDCPNPSPLQFEPNPNKKVINFSWGSNSSLTCRANHLQVPRSKPNLTLSMEVRPLFNFVADENDYLPAYDLPTNDSYLPLDQDNSSVPSTGKPIPLCWYDVTPIIDKSMTIEFPKFNYVCAQVYICKAGYNGFPSYESSVFVMFHKPAKVTGHDHKRNRKVSGRFKRPASFFQQLNNTHLDDESSDSHEDDDHDDDDDDDEKKYKKRFNPTGYIIGATFLLVLAGAVVAVGVVWKKRIALRHSRFLSRRVSSSKVPLFINKSYTKPVKSELEEFPRKNIRFLDHIGKGTFGSVVMAEVYNMNKHKGAVFANRWTTVAVKMTLKKSNEQLKKDFLCELALMKTIPAHNNIITLHASCTAHDPYLIILEYAEHGDLRKYLLKHRSDRNYANAAFSMYGVKSTGNLYSQSCHLTCAVDITEKRPEHTDTPKDNAYVNIPSSDGDLIASRDLLSFALQICRGLDHLSKNKIVHRDVAARNVLVCEHKVVKISDFGLARKVGDDDLYERSTKGLLPIRWMSPESLFCNQFSEKSDVWSYGVLLWELITLGSTPYPGLDSPSVLEKIRKRDLLTCPPHSSSVVNAVVTNCWIEDPLVRPCFSTLVEHLEKLLESEVEYLDLDQINDHEYSTLD